MGKYISIFFFILFASVILFFIFANFFDGGNATETAIYTVGTIIIMLLSFLVSLMYYLIDLVKK